MLRSAINLFSWFGNFLGLLVFAAQNAAVRDGIVVEKFGSLRLAASGIGPTLITQIGI